MAKILDENNNVLFEGHKKEMLLAYEYLTKPSWELAETRGLCMTDFYSLNKKYWNNKTRTVKKFKINKQ